MKHIRRTYVDNAAQRPDGIRPVDDLRVGLHILHDTARHHNDVLSRQGQFFDGEVDHLTERTLQAHEPTEQLR